MELLIERELDPEEESNRHRIRVRLDVNEEELLMLKRADMLHKVIYTSAQAERHEKAVSEAAKKQNLSGLLGAAYHYWKWKQNFKITVASLIEGHTIQSRSMYELSRIEVEVWAGVRDMRAAIDYAAQYGGEEDLHDV